MSGNERGLQVSEVSKSYAGTRVLESVTFTCAPGRITGLLGPNGSGKSTVMRIMLALARADSGAVTFDCTPFEHLASPGRVVGAMVDPGAHHPGRNVRETLAHAAILMNVPLTRSREVMDTLGLASVGRRRFGALSLGMKQRVSLAIALMARPRYLILDEPMNGLDVETADWLREALVHQARVQDACVLLSTHLLEELQSFADDIVVLNRGEVSFAGAVSEQDRSRCVVVTSEPVRLRRALDLRGIVYASAPTTPGQGDEIESFQIDADHRAVGLILRDEAILIHELAPSRESIRATYARVTDGAFRARGTGA